MGHTSITVTLDRYGHLFPSIGVAVADGLEATYRAGEKATPEQGTVTALRPA